LSCKLMKKIKDNFGAAVGGIVGCVVVAVVRDVV
jgi:hypothetical protein